MCTYVDFLQRFSSSTVKHGYRVVFAARQNVLLIRGQTQHDVTMETKAFDQWLWSCDRNDIKAKDERLLLLRCFWMKSVDTALSNNATELWTCYRRVLTNRHHSYWYPSLQNEQLQSSHTSVCIFGKVHIGSLVWNRARFALKIGNGKAVARTRKNAAVLNLL